ncbi:uncharacterized protein LOC143229828 isoform X7 [Tachypleus tridentatus]|uniref:uncharacterized protein LOC143229828 isoform X7 n=1 Tax=Tachypleus tridentatus TaxID=6853 RepID=UPI003FD3D872
MEKRPMVVLNPSQNSYGRQHFDQYERSDPQVTNDSDGCQIETIILDHQYPDPAYPLHHNDLMFAAKKWEEQDQFTVFSALATFVCIISYVINVGTDVAVSYFLYVEDNLWWFGLTAAATAIPSLTVNIFSIRWYVHDAKERKTHPRALSRPHMTKLDWVVRIFFHMVLLGPIIRYIDLLIYGFRSRRLRKQKRRREQNWHLSYRQPSPVRIEQPTEVNYHLLMIQEDRDTALLALLESFMESTPQLLLQVYILSQREQVPTDFFTESQDANSVKDSEDEENGKDIESCLVTCQKLQSVKMLDCPFMGILHCNASRILKCRRTKGNIVPEKSTGRHQKTTTRDGHVLTKLTRQSRRKSCNTIQQE